MPTVEERNIEAVRTVYSCFREFVMGPVFRVLAPDVDWLVPGAPDVPFAGHYHGHEGVQRYFSTLSATIKVDYFIPSSFTADGDTVIVRGCEAGFPVWNFEKRWEGAFTHVYTVRDGKICRVREEYEVAAVAKVFADGPAPYEVAAATWVVPQIIYAPPCGYVYFNSMVIGGDEPILVDTGSPNGRDAWLRAVGKLVDLPKVRHIFLSHDDRDHAGNLQQALTACPDAVLLTTWYAAARLTEEFPVPFKRCKMLDDGERISIDGRTLRALRPPLFDSPTTRGLYDERTRVLWSADCFGAFVKHHVEDAAQIDETDWRRDLQLLNRINHPWHTLIDAEKFRKFVARFQDLELQVIAGCHGPAIRGARIAAAFDAILQLPALPEAPPVAQTQWDKLLERMFESPPEKAPICAPAAGPDGPQPF